MNKKIVVTGATGLIGKRLVKKLLERNYDLTIFTRSPETAKLIFPKIKNIVYWNEYASSDLSQYLDGKDAVFHLAGANIAAKRWTQNYKSQILNSRVISSRILYHSLENCKQLPSVFISASAIGYYGNTVHKVITEEAKNGYDFLAHVCKSWEDEISRIKEYGIRWVGVRTGIVLDKEGGALKKMLIPFKLFVGGSLGNGRQYFSWIHIEDIINIFLYALDNAKIEGPINATAPNPVTMKIFSKTLGNILKRPSFFNVPAFLLRIILGESSQMILTSQRVYPQKLQENGYKFKFEFLEDALSDLVLDKSKSIK